MKDFWDGLASVAKVLIISTSLIILGFMMTTCGMFGILVSG